MLEKKINKGLLTSFVNGMYLIDEYIKKFDPDILIFPIRGAVAINDILRVINCDNISSRQIEYLYSSSSVYKVNEVIRESVKNLLIEHHVPGEEIKILTIDEVVSGHSLARETKYMKMGTLDYINNNEHLGRENLDEIVFKNIAIVDERYKKKGKPYQKGYEKLLEQDLVYSVTVNENIVMDKPQYCPVKMKRKDLHTHYPLMERFEITRGYLELLRYIASFVGQDLKLVALQNPEAIVHSERLIPEKYKNPKETSNLTVSL